MLGTRMPAFLMFRNIFLRRVMRQCLVLTKNTIFLPTSDSNIDYTMETVFVFRILTELLVSGKFILNLSVLAVLTKIVICSSYFKILNLIQL